MMLFKSIDWLLVGTRYLSWGIGLLGMIGSVILFMANIPFGLGAAAVFIASSFLAIGVTLLLLPKQLAKREREGNRRYVIGLAACAIALVLMFVIWNMEGGLPAVNLIFA